MQNQDPSRPATGYPYPYPPPQQPAPATNGYPHNPYYAAQQPNPRSVLLRRLFIISMFFLITFFLLLFIFFLIVRPQLPSVSITSLSVSNFNVTSNHLSGQWDLTLQVNNPNSKMTLHYETIYCLLYYGRESLANTRLQPLDQGKKDQTNVNVTLSVLETYVDDRLVDAFGKERNAKGSVEFDLKFNSIVSFKYGAFRKRRFVTVYCDDVAVGVATNSSDGKMVGSAKQCKSY